MKEDIFQLIVFLAIVVAVSSTVSKCAAMEDRTRNMKACMEKAEKPADCEFLVGESK